MSNINNKIIYIIIAIVLILGIFYLISATGGGDDQLLSSDAGSPATKVDDSAIIKALSTVHNIHLDANIFDDPAFISLEDFTKAIIDEPRTREDPFAPLKNTGVVVSGGGQVLLR